MPVRPSITLQGVSYQVGTNLTVTMPGAEGGPQVVATGQLRLGEKDDRVVIGDEPFLISSFNHRDLYQVAKS